MRNAPGQDSAHPQSSPTHSNHSHGGGLFGSVGGGLLGNIMKGGKSIVKKVHETATMVKEELHAHASKCERRTFLFDWRRPDGHKSPGVWNENRRLCFTLSYAKATVAV